MCKDVWHLAHLFQAENTGKEQASGLGVMKCAPKTWQSTMYSIYIHYQYPICIKSQVISATEDLRSFRIHLNAFVVPNIHLNPEGSCVQMFPGKDQRSGNSQVWRAVMSRGDPLMSILSCYGFPNPVEERVVTVRCDQNGDIDMSYKTSQIHFQSCGDTFPPWISQCMYYVLYLFVQWYHARLVSWVWTHHSLRYHLQKAHRVSKTSSWFGLAGKVVTASEIRHLSPVLLGRIYYRCSV